MVGFEDERVILRFERRDDLADAGLSGSHFAYQCIAEFCDHLLTDDDILTLYQLFRAQMLIQVLAGHESVHPDIRVEINHPQRPS